MTSMLGLGITALLIAGFIWFFPILLILQSRKTNGAEKLFWILAVVFVSWFAWVFYLLMAPLSEDRA
jgi:hypothetical protein